MIVTWLWAVSCLLELAHYILVVSNCVEQPFNLPIGLDLFSWSLPYLADKIGEMMDHLLKKNELVDRNSIKLAK